MEKIETVYLQGDDAGALEKDGYCEICLKHSKHWAKPDRFGNYEVHAYKHKGNIVGFICPKCAKAEKRRLRKRLRRLTIHESPPPKPRTRLKSSSRNFIERFIVKTDKQKQKVFGYVVKMVPAVITRDVKTGRVLNIKKVKPV